jgi:sugar/nucleoside kinase (ribokinase family)
MLDIISIGDCTLDVFLDIDEATVSCEIKREQCVICFNYADKIPVKKITKIPAAGNAANNAVGSSRLAMRSAIYTIIGGDKTGKEIKENFRNEKVSTKYIRCECSKETNYSTVLNYNGERTILVYHYPRNYRLPTLMKSKWLYYTSLGQGHGKLHSSLLTYLKKYPDTKLGFNPGTHQLREGLISLKPIIKKTEILFVNKQEAEGMLGTNNRPIKNLMLTLHEMGANNVVITDGANGAYAHDGKKFYHLPIFKKFKAIERTGAGDAFSTGVIAGLFWKKSLGEALRWGSANSSSVIGFIGPQQGLLTKSKMLAFLRKNPNPKTKII